MKKLLPQANSLETVIKVFIYVGSLGESNLEDIASFCNFEPRQASYYLNACYYLDLVDDKGNITDFGRKVLADDLHMEKAIYERIVTDAIIGKVFAHMLLFPLDDIDVFTFELVKGLYPEYSEAVQKRRASTLISWCKEIHESTQKKRGLLGNSTPMERPSRRSRSVTSIPDIVALSDDKGKTDISEAIQTKVQYNIPLRLTQRQSFALQKQFAKYLEDKYSRKESYYIFSTYIPVINSLFTKFINERIKSIFDFNDPDLVMGWFENILKNDSEDKPKVEVLEACKSAIEDYAEFLRTNPEIEERENKRGRPSKMPSSVYDLESSSAPIIATASEDEITRIRQNDSVRIRREAQEQRDNEVLAILTSDLGTKKEKDRPSNDVILPCSLRQSDLDKWKGIFKHTSTSYKFFWILGLLECVRKQPNLKLYNLKYVTSQMIAQAWPVVKTLRLNLGKTDKLSSHIKSINSVLGLSSTATPANVYSRVYVSSDSMVKSVQRQLGAMVPYRFLAPWITFVSDKQVIADSQNPLYRTPYSLEESRHELTVRVTNDWREFLLTNVNALRQFVYKELAEYLHSNNPGKSTEDILGMLEAM